MLNEKLKEKLSALFQRVNNGDLSGGGEISQKMFISTIDVLISEEKRELELKIAAQEQQLLILKNRLENEEKRKG
jgi:hypothetical protein